MEGLKFSAEMAQLIAEGRKVAIRRPLGSWADRHEIFDRFKPGTEYFVAEPFAVHKEQRANGFRLFLGGLYKVLGGKFQNDFAVFPASKMEEDQARTRLVVKGVYVERLRDLNELDLEAEGIHPEGGDPYRKFKNYQFGKKGPKYFRDPFASFFSLWDSFYGESDNRFDHDPIVYVVTFKAYPITRKPGLFYTTGEASK